MKTIRVLLALCLAFFTAVLATASDKENAYNLVVNHQTLDTSPRIRKDLVPRPRQKTRSGF